MKRIFATLVLAAALPVVAVLAAPQGLPGQAVAVDEAATLIGGACSSAGVVPCGVEGAPIDAPCEGNMGVCFPEGASVHSTVAGQGCTLDCAAFGYFLKCAT